MKIEIREITKKDNFKINEVLVSVMKEFAVPDHGTAMQDDELNFMYESYQNNNSIYYIVYADDKKTSIGLLKKIIPEFKSENY